MPRWMIRIFLSQARRLRNGWWITAFLIVLASLLFPAIMAPAHWDRPLAMPEEALIILIATMAIQKLRRRPVFEVVGRLDRRWSAQLALGAVLGAALMAAPALFLTLKGWVHWEAVFADPPALWSAVALMTAAAAAEELLFRGVLFQRLIDGVGVWPAQILISLLFFLTHMGNPGMEGSIRLLAGANIFLASILFGLAYVRTRSLALPFGLHLSANLTQGVVLGFGVSGAAEPSLLTPLFRIERDWLTGGAFGLEGSLPGLIAVIVLLAALAVAGRGKSTLPYSPASRIAP